MRMFIKKPKYKATATGFTSIWKVNGKNSTNMVKSH